MSFAEVVQREQPDQQEDGGSSPTPPLHSYRVYPADRADVRKFIEENHYSHSINGVKSSFCFAMFRGEELVGAAIFGAPATKGVSESYATSPENVMELRRLCLVDDTPKNAESFFIAKMVKWLQKNTPITTIISYADPAYGHVGTIYKASNFTCVGATIPVKTLLWNGKKYHDRALRVKYKGKLKPFSQRLRDALAKGEAVWVDGHPKFIYVYEIKRKETR